MEQDTYTRSIDLEGPPMTAAMEVDADLVSRGDVLVIVGERRRYRVTAVAHRVVIPTQAQEARFPEDDRARVAFRLVPISRGGVARTVTLRPTDRVKVYA